MKQEQEPAEERVDELGPGVLRVQLPIDLPGLGHVNAYVLTDERGAAVVDPGLPGPDAWNALVHRLDLAGFRLRDVHTVVVTHSHPDHYGNSGKLAEEAGAEVVTHAAFRLWWRPDPCDAHVHEVDPDDVAGGNPFDGPTPWGTEGFRSQFRQRMDELGAAFVHPRPACRLRDGDRITLGGREWQAIHTPGHTLDHLCLFDPEHDLLLSGDHVLPTITPHISGLGTGRDPLKAFVSSLERVAALPASTTALPAHGHPFGDLRARVADIRHHHERRLDRLRAALANGRATVPELSDHLFKPEHRGPMAESETYAHLEHLRLVGELERRREGDGLVYEQARRTSPT
jgi:glyoxylase-like metal-dependent hydrolase (beta-lactamase superfamily II)